MQPLTDAQIRASFVNWSAGDVDRMRLPDLAHVPWENLDMLGWVDPSTPTRAYLVSDGALVGVRLRVPSQPPAARRTSMCALCLTVHPPGGVALMSAPRAGSAADQLGSIGTYLCADLACSLYVRGLRGPGHGSPETTDREARITRLRSNLAAFLARVVGEYAAHAAAAPPDRP